MNTIILTTLCDSFQAHILKDVLLNEGIVSFTKNETMSSIYSNINAFQIELSVFEKDYEKAKDIFEKGFPQLAK
jgi:hypothetical protein